MNLKFLFREPDKWILKDGYWIKENKETASSTIDEYGQDILEEGVQISVSWQGRCRRNFIVSLIDKYFAVRKSISFASPRREIFQGMIL